MKKKVLRLTESDLHNIIKRTVQRIIKEDVLDNNNINMTVSEISNINHIEIDTIENGEAIFNASGNDGSQYQIYVSYYISEGMGEIPSSDYDVPSDYDGDSIHVMSVTMTKWNDMNEEEEIPYSKNMRFESMLSSKIEEYLHSKGMINNH